MARGKLWLEVEEDPRPHGSVLFADPSMAKLTGRVKPFNEPYNVNNAVGEVTGIRSMTGHMTPYGDRTGTYVGDGAWRAMNEKRGTLQETEDE